ncbi:P-type ATPase, cytoplasmic domain N [Phytophthora cactorum]|nr:P-type ATPase, cytoplasmic domain N [Phytophthora cactorum]
MSNWSTLLMNRFGCTLEVTARFGRFGENRVLIDKPRIPILLFHKLIAPFYIFQVISAIIWFIEEYTVYAIIIVLLSAASITYEIYVEVSNSNPTQVHESELVPGDIVDVNEGPVCADILLLSGLCVADEASLTGEAVPVNKESAVGSGEVTEIQTRSQYKASCLHAGSTIIRVREGSGNCRGVVLSTGFSTGRGELFRSILFPKPIAFEFERDSYRYLIVLWSIAIAAFLKRVIDGVGTDTPFFSTLLHSLDLITIAVFPALPLVLSSGIGFAMQRLQKAGIFCIDSRRVNSCGQISCYCFDKTGTLTKEHLSFVGVDNLEASGSGFPSLDMTPQVKLVLATCHGLSKHEGTLQGYPLEIAMFNASRFDMECLNEQAKGGFIAEVTSTDDVSKKYGILKRFAFDAAHQRSSTIVEELETKKRFVVVKGSPEAICAISTSTPADLLQNVHTYSADGFYCIGFGMKELNSSTIPIDKIVRDDVECTVEFQGLAIFKNELKQETKGMLDELQNAKIDVRIITGDNALTAVHVCRELEMSLKPKIAVVDVDASSRNTVFISADTVKTSATAEWESFSNNTMDRIMTKYDLAITGAALEKIGSIQKTWIVEQLIDMGLIVGMCGDGTNDCGALKAAHVGLALSSAEASIVAPFTSKAKAILDIPVLLREGRFLIFTAGFASALAVLHHEGSWFCSIKDALAYVNDGDLTVPSGCAVFKDYDMEAMEYSYEGSTTWLFVHLSYIVVAIAFNIVKDSFRLPVYTNRIFTVLTILYLL